MLHATLRLVMRLIVLIVVADVKLIPAETFEICGKKGAKRRSARLNFVLRERINELA